MQYIGVKSAARGPDAAMKSGLPKVKKTVYSQFDQFDHIDINTRLLTILMMPA